MHGVRIGFRVPCVRVRNTTLLEDDQHAFGLRFVSLLGDRRVDCRPDSQTGEAAHGDADETAAIELAA